jgi:translation initiation factor 3 subunit F
MEIWCVYIERKERESEYIFVLIVSHRSDFHFSLSITIQVEVTNCFAVPHAERGDEVAIGKDFNKQMLNLHLRGNRKEAVVGWYATAASTTIADTSSLIHEFYATEVDDGDPVHVTVDTRLLQDQLNVCAYISVPVVVQGEVLANLFHQVPLKMESAEHETICLDQMAHPTKRRGVEQQQLSADGSPTTALQVSMEHLLELLETASAYVDSVVSGTTLPDSKIGRHIADTLNSVPRIQPAVFDKLYQDSLQDLLMVTYLSNITKTQLTIAEKLNASLGAV